MNLRLVCLICLVFGYLCGSFQTALFVGKYMGVDLRTKGSGNLGTTNVIRVLGIRAGVFTYICDISKVFIAMAVVYLVVKGFHLDIPIIPLFLYTGLGAIIGHDFPFYLKFKGGKGVAATSAVLIALWDWKLVAVGIIVFFGIVFLTQYVSLSSMCLITAEFIAFILFTQIGLIKLDAAWMPDCYIIMFLMMVLIIIRHMQNIDRLIKGKESKFFLSIQQGLDSRNSQNTEKGDKNE